MRQRLEKGQEVVIEAMGMKLKGEVKATAYNWGDSLETPNWNIEFLSTDGVYRYWKQSEDGGHLREIDGNKIVSLKK